MVVRMRSTKGRRNDRRSHFGVKYVAKKTEGDIVRPMHRASRITGIYKGKVIIDTAKKLNRLEAKKSEKLNKDKNEDSQNVVELPTIDNK